MRLYDHVGVSSWLLVGISGLALTCSQACANGKTHETGTEVTISGGTGTGQAGAQSSGGNSVQGGTGNNGGTSAVPTGGNGQGGANNTGGAADGGNPSTGGQA